MLETTSNVFLITGTNLDAATDSGECEGFFTETPRDTLAAALLGDFSLLSPGMRNTLRHCEADGTAAWLETETAFVQILKPNREKQAAAARREQRERAMEIGLGLGVDAYNDAMGYSAD